MNIIFNELRQQRVKYDVHTTSKIKHSRHFLSHNFYCLFIGYFNWNREMCGLLVRVDGVWRVKSREKVSLGSNTVSCLLAVNREIWAACDASIHVISIATSSSSSSSSSKLVVTKVCCLLLKQALSLIFISDVMFCLSVY